MTTDPIADLLTRMRNALLSKQEKFTVPASKMKESILKILKKEGYIKNYIREEQAPQDNLVVILKYIEKTHKPVLTKLKRVSKPGCRVYRSSRDIRPLLGGVGFSILSTPNGILTDKEAIQQKVGGEVLCEIW